MRRKFFGVVLLGASLFFAGHALAQEVEHLALPAPSVTDRPLPPARDGGIYLPHVSGGGAAQKTETVKAGKAKAGKSKAGKSDKKAVKTVAKGKTPVKANKKAVKKAAPLTVKKKASKSK